MIREIVHIDEDKCDGCGDCVPSCAEGAIRIVDGKAKLVAENMCDGMGACLGVCSRDAIRIERRECEAFDETAVEAAMSSHTASATPRTTQPLAGCPSARPIGLNAGAAFSGCPSSQARVLDPVRAVESERLERDTSSCASSLSHWPVQLHLVPPTAPYLVSADVLLCATCTPVAMADFHDRLLAGRVVLVACPKLDNPNGYLEKLAQIMANASISSFTIARMAVPCCGGLVRLAKDARSLAGVTMTIREIVVGLDGQVAMTLDHEVGVDQPRTVAALVN